MATSEVAEGASHSSSSGIFFQGSNAVENSNLSLSFGNSLDSFLGGMHLNLGPLYGDANDIMLNSVASSGPSVGTSSLVTDADSGLSGGPNLQRSASINMDSYMSLPTSPMSFSSNNITISGSSVIDGSSVMQQSSSQDPNSLQTHHNHLNQGASSATSLSTTQNGQLSLFNGHRFVEDPDAFHVQKKPRLNIKQEYTLQQQIVQQILQRQDSAQCQASNHQLQALVQQQRLGHHQQQQQHQQQQPHSMPQSQQPHLLQQRQQQLSQQLQQQGLQSVSGVKRTTDVGVCSRRLMQYLYHQRQRPPDNSIPYWRKFVAEYYSPRAKIRWCLSLYDNAGHHSHGVFPQAAMDAWQCDMCCSKSGRGFEATFEVLPRLNEIKFASGVTDELWFLDLPRECRLPCGILMLEYEKAVQESVYEQLRVVREGQLRVIFTADLKILCWEFCARRHEDFLPRRLVAQQVNQLLQVAQKYQSTMAESGPDGAPQQDLHNNCNMFVTSGHQLAKSLDVPHVNEMGFSKRYMRCLQISEVVNNMKDLMDFCRDQKRGPVEGMKVFSQHASPFKFQLQRLEREKLAGARGLSTDRSTYNGEVSNKHQMVSRGALSGSAEATLDFSDHQSRLTRQNLIRSNSNSHQQGAISYSCNNSSHNPSPSILGSTLQKLPHRGFPKSYLLQLQQHSVNGDSILQQNCPQSSHGNQVLQHHMIQQLRQDLSNRNAEGLQQQRHTGQSMNVSDREDRLWFGTTPATVNGYGSGGGDGHVLTRSNTSKTTSSRVSSADGGNNGSCQKAPYLLQDAQLSDNLVHDMIHEVAENDFFNNDIADAIPFNWKERMI